jgi:hypothetical protein
MLPWGMLRPYSQKLDHAENTYLVKRYSLPYLAFSDQQNKKRVVTLTPGCRTEDKGPIEESQYYYIARM